MALTLEQRVEAEKLRAQLDERRYIRRLIDAGRRGENPTAGLSAMNPNPVTEPPRRREYQVHRDTGGQVTARLSAQAGSEAYRRTFVDRNRILKVTDRRFHAAWEEMRGGKLWITETVASECVPGRRMDDLEALRTESARLCSTEPHGSIRAKDAAQDVWWIDEWRSENGIVGLRRLNAEQVRERDALLEQLLPEHFGCADRDEVEQLPDARIVAETVTLGEDLLLSSNFNRVEVEDLNAWLRKHAQRIPQTGEGPVHLVDGYIKECMEQTEAGRVLGLQAVLAGFWPEDRGADEEEVVASALMAAGRMTRKGAHLNQTGTYLAERLTDPGWRRWIAATIHTLRASGGIKVQGAGRRHPKHRAWERKRYDDNTPELAKALDAARWRIPERGYRLQT